MKVKIKRFDKSIPLPEYKTKGSTAFDLRARIDVIIKPKSIGYIPLNVAIETPKGYWALLAARSSTHKYGLFPINGIGVGDWDFRGDNDEYQLIAYNFTDEDILVEKGMRIAQMLIIKNDKVVLEEVSKLDGIDRGGIGSTGKM